MKLINLRKINLQKIIIISLLITLSFVLEMFADYIHLNDVVVPVLWIRFFQISGIPLMLMMIVLEFRYSFLGIILYSIICFCWKVYPKYEYLFVNFGYKSGLSRTQFDFFYGLTNFFIPLYCYLFLSFLYNKNINNLFNKRNQIFLFLLLLMIFQIISKTFNGYYVYFYPIKEKLLTERLHLEIKDNNIIFFIIMFINLVTNLTTNLFNFFVCLKILFHIKNINFFKTL